MDLVNTIKLATSLPVAQWLEHPTAVRTTWLGIAMQRVEYYVFIN